MTPVTSRQVEEVAVHPSRFPVALRVRIVGGAAVLAVLLAGLFVPAAAAAAPPEAPANPVVTSDGQSLDVTWEAPGGSDPVTGYLLRVLDADDQVVTSYRVPGDTLEHRFAGLDNGTYTVTITALGADGASDPSGESAPAEVALDLLAAYDFSDTDTAPGSTVADASGNGHPATLRGNGATVTGAALNLPGGANGSGAAHVELPTGLFDGRDTLTVSTWLRNETASGNYAAMFFGTNQNPPSRYWLLNPRNPAGRFKSVITDGPVSTTAPWGTERGFTPTTASRGVPGPLTDANWGLYTTVITPTQITAYYNGVKIDTVDHTTPVSTFGSNLVGYIGRSSYPDALYKGGVRDVRIYTTALTDATVAAQYAFQQVQADAAALEVPDETAIDLDLPARGASGSQISWSSSDPSVISAEGTVSRPTGADAEVTLTAAVTKGGKQVTRTFEVTVLADDPAADVARVADTYDVAITHVTDDIVLKTEVDGVAVAWESTAPDVLAADGQVTRPEKRTDVTLTATFSREGHSATREYDLVVLSADAGRVGTYIRTGNTNRTDAVHLAHAADDATTFTALNNGRPVRYADNGAVKLGSPTAFRKPDGSFGLVATVDSNSSSIYVYDSSDLITFENQRLVPFNGQGLNAAGVRVAYDNGIARYRLTFTALGDGTTYQVRTRDFEQFSAPVEVDPLPAPPATNFPADALEPSSIGVTPAEYAAVLRKYTRMVNTGVEPLADVTVPAGGAVPLPESATATYSNGGADTQMGIEWDADDVAAVDTDTPGEYVVNGTVLRPSYPEKLAHQRADPDVTRGPNGKYYLTASYPQVGSNPQGYDRVVLRRADTIAGLADAEEVVIWHEADSALQRYVWAPELEEINGTWYILFTASRSSNVFDIRPMMLRHTGGDLMNPANWVEVGAMLAQSGDRAFTSFSLDMTHFEHEGRHYVIWAQSAPSSALLMAEIDPDNPRQLISPSVTIAYPDYAWEGNTSTNQYIDEGAAVLKRGDKIYMTFSASTVDDKYSIGLLTADVDADLLDPASWRKTAYPLLATADLPAGQSGPGHNSFTVDEFGNPVMAYHSRTIADMTDGGLTDPSRHARARTVHFDGDGDPVLNMTPAEELLEEHRDVQVRVVVEEAQATEPGAPATPTVSQVTTTSATVQWNPPTQSGGSAVTGYRVRVTHDGEEVSVTDVTGTNHQVTGLAAGTTYAVTVRARNSVGLGPASEPAEFSTMTLPSPYAHYPLATDLSETVVDRDATAVGAVTFEQGLTLPGNSNSSTNHVRLPDNLLQGAGEQVTISLWVKSDSPPRNGAAMAFSTPPVNNLPANYWLLNPTGPTGSARSVMTNGVNATQPWSTEVRVEGPNTIDRRGSWVNYTTVLTPDSLTSYVDGVKIGTVAKTRTLANFLAAGTLQGYLGRSGYSADPAFKGSFRELQIFDSALSDPQVGELAGDDAFILDAARDRLTLGDTSAVSADLALPTDLGDGVTVTWETSDGTVVTADGKVTVGAASRTATLTASLARGGRSITREFEVTVVGRAVVVAAAADLLIVPPMLASGDALPTVDVDGVTTEWATETEHLAVDDAQVSTDRRTTGELTATVSADGVAPVTKTFAVTVLPKADARFLLGYTRAPLATQSYSANLAYGLHLAMGPDRSGVPALNENHGILYAEAVSTDTVEVNEVRGLRDPFVFRTADGEYGVVATRTLSGGTPDDSADDSMLLFTSPDLLHFTEVGIVEVAPDSGGVRAPRAFWDSSSEQYVVAWETTDGTPMFATADDVADASSYGAPAAGAPWYVAADATTPATGAVPGNTVVIDVATARALRTRFGRITNTAVDVAPVEAAIGEELDLTGVRAELSYDDGSTATRAIDWDAEDVAAVDTDTPGSYQIAGTVRQTDYAFPFIAGRADPAIIRWKGKFLFTSTTESGQARFDLRSADTLNGLRSAADRTILTTSGSLPGPLWAPEFHDIGGRLYLFFASGVERNCWCNVQAHVMELVGDDPTDREAWGVPRVVEKRDGGLLELDAEHPGISLDMTYFEDEQDGETVAYVAWSQRYIVPGTTGDAQLWIATVDPSDPARLTSDPVLFATAAYGWDHNTAAVAEAPDVIRKGDTLYLTYSGSATDSTYVVGLLTAPAGADLLDPASWTKSNYPVLKSDPSIAQLGPGHSMFTLDEDGNDILVYHARNNGGSRDAAIRRVHWASDGMPILDMTKDEEVAPGNRQVTAVVTVGAHPDTTAPELDVTVDPAKPDGRNGWYRTTVSVTASATDPEVADAETSGEVVIEQRVGNGDWTSYDGPVAVGEGVRSLSFRAADAAGNASGVQTVRVSRDPTAPRLTLRKRKNRTAKVKVTARAFDVTSGVAALRYRVDGGRWRPYSGPVKVRKPGRHRVFVRATDRAGNVTVGKVRIRVVRR